PRQDSRATARSAGGHRRGATSETRRACRRSPTTCRAAGRARGRRLMANLGYLQLTRNCLQHCRFCSNPPTGVELTEPEMCAMVDELVDMGYDGVTLAGGEPTLSPLLPAALRYARERGLFSRMITNGQRLADADFFRECVDNGLTHIHVSLHSYRREVH